MKVMSVGFMLISLYVWRRIVYFVPGEFGYGAWCFLYWVLWPWVVNHLGISAFGGFGKGERDVSLPML
jgi:hypothetical protein